MLQNNNNDATQQCMTQIMESAKQDIESCMQAQFPSFTFPAFNASHPFYGHHPGGEMAKPSDEEIKKILSQSCQTDAARQSVVSCMKSLIDSKKSQLTAQTQQPKPDFSAMKTKMCDKKNQCIATLSSNCQAQLSSMKDQMCTCVKNEVSSKGDAFKAQMKACMPNSSSTNEQATGDQKRRSSSGKFTGAQQSHDAKQGVQKFVDMVCTDPCASSN
uniref:Uncharacterized protein n=1 Tax=Romanomermis culicivorax TaxID=13658 RepID=A0A915HK24_ROMCU